VLLAVVGVVELGGRLEALVLTFAAFGLGLGQKVVDFGLGHRLEIAGDSQILLEVLPGRDPAHQGADRQRQGIAAANVAAYADLFGDGATAERLHADHPDSSTIALRHDLLLEAAVVGVEDVDGHLGGSPVEGLGEHGEVMVDVLVAGKADVADLARLPRLQGRLEHAAFHQPLGIFPVVDLVELPEVHAIGLQPLKAVVQAGQ